MSETEGNGKSSTWRGAWAFICWALGREESGPTCTMEGQQHPIRQLIGTDVDLCRFAGEVNCSGLAQLLRHNGVDVPCSMCAAFELVGPRDSRASSYSPLGPVPVQSAEI